jgi:hypothetical protein
MVTTLLPPAVQIDSVNSRQHRRAIANAINAIIKLFFPSTGGIITGDTAVEGAFGALFDSGITVPKDGSTVAVFDTTNGSAFNDWLVSTFGKFGVFLVSTSWDTGNAASSACFAMCGDNGGPNHNVVLLAKSNFGGGDTTTDGTKIYFSNPATASSALTSATCRVVRLM